MDEWKKLQLKLSETYDTFLKAIKKQNNLFNIKKVKK